MSTAFNEVVMSRVTAGWRTGCAQILSIIASRCARIFFTARLPITGQHERRSLGQIRRQIGNLQNIHMHKPLLKI